MATGTLISRLSPASATLPASGFAPLDLNQLAPVLSFSDTQDWAAFFLLRMPSALAYHGGGVRVDLLISTPAGAGTTGNALFGVALKRLVDEADDLSSAGFAAEKTVAVPAPDPAASVRRAGISLNPAEIDAVADDDWFLVRVRRLGADAADTATGHVHLVALELREA